jgi:acyl-CoA dehydrogenase
VDLEPSDEQRMVVQTIRRFMQERILPLEQELDPDAFFLPLELKEPLVAEVKAMGFYNLDVPVQYGGPDITLVTRTMIAEETAQHRAGLYAPAYGVFGNAGLAQLYEGTEEQKQRYLYPMLRGEKQGFFALTEPAGGSDPARAIETRAVRDGDEWILNGSKIFISESDTADFGLVFARSDPSRGRQGITCFIVDTDSPGFLVRRVIHTLRTSMYPSELEFNDLRVPHGNILGKENGGFGLANEVLTRNRIPYSAGCIGVAVAAQRMAAAYAKQRRTFGDLLSQRQAIQWMIVDNEIDIRSSRWLTLAAADRADRGEPFRFETAMAKLVATEGAGRVVDRAIQIHGGYGVTKDLPLERWYRELRIRRIGEGPSEVQRIIMARELLFD